jgi:citrate synthase
VADTSTFRSDLARSTATTVHVRDFDLCNDLLGKVTLTEMVFVTMKGKLPSAAEARVLDACLVALVEHGITPSSIATRITYLGAPESMQAAVAAGLLGLGSVFVGTIEGSARMLYDALNDKPADHDLAALADAVVEGLIAKRQPVPGLGHPVHRPIDPRAQRLFEIAEENGKSGRYVQLMRLIHAAAERRTGRVLPLNATGAIGAIVLELGFDPRISRGFGLMSRTIGLVAHIYEELQHPLARGIWEMVEREAQPGERP